MLETTTPTMRGGIVAEARKDEEPGQVPEASLTSLPQFDTNQDIARLERTVEEKIGLASDGQI